MRLRHCLIPAALAVLLASPAWAQQGTPRPNPLAPPSGGPQPTLAPEPAPAPAPPPAEAKPGQVQDEVIITAPRAGEPDYQAVQEYHAREFARLNAIYGKPSVAEPQGDQTFETGGTMGSPNTRSDTVDAIRNAPRARDTLGGQ